MNAGFGLFPERTRPSLYRWFYAETERFAGAVAPSGTRCVSIPASIAERGTYSTARPNAVA